MIISIKIVISKNFNKSLVIDWTSENKYINKFIQDAQLNARSKLDLLEWIPYNQLRNIKYLTQDLFSTIYDAI